MISRNERFCTGRYNLTDDIGKKRIVPRPSRTWSPNSPRRDPPVGDYTAPNQFTGKIENMNVRVA
jgi:hypothetical protein